MSYTGTEVLNELTSIKENFNRKLSSINSAINNLIKQNDKLNSDNVILLNKIANTKLLELLNENIKPLTEMDILSLNMITSKREDSLTSLENKLSSNEFKKNELLAKINQFDLDISNYDHKLNAIKSNVKDVVMQKSEYIALLAEKSYLTQSLISYKEKSNEITELVNSNSSAFLNNSYFNYLYSKNFNISNESNLIYKIDLLLANYINYFEEKNKFEFLNGLSQYISSLIIKTEKEIKKMKKLFNHYLMQNQNLQMLQN